jgi:tRNA-splicing ligase RtcB
VLELPDWGLSHTTARLKDVAAAQLGGSGNGNHFVDLGRFEALEPGLPTNRLAILSHSGGRRPGGEVAYEYLRLARQRSKDLSRAYRPWAWLEFDSDLGEQFWRAMNLVERYASACHDVIHASLSSALGGSTLLTVDCCIAKGLIAWPKASWPSWLARCALPPISCAVWEALIL